MVIRWTSPNTARRCDFTVETFYDLRLQSRIRQPDCYASAKLRNARPNQVNDDDCHPTSRAVIRPVVFRDYCSSETGESVIHFPCLFHISKYSVQISSFMDNNKMISKVWEVQNLVDALAQEVDYERAKGILLFLSFSN